jgi:catechol 2,3-dioxygenase
MGLKKHMTYQLPAEIQLGAVHLTVANLERSITFYCDGLGFKLHQKTETMAYLGGGGSDLLVLTANPAAHPLRRGQTGLFHFAVLLPTRWELAQMTWRLLNRQLLGGASDHDVSEALYLSDPDGNGIEIYRDRPQNQWRWQGDQLVMRTYRLDLENILQEMRYPDTEWAGLSENTRIGHMHLHVRDVAEAERFYHDLLGFDVMARYGEEASFLAAGGYHHHLGVNTWAGHGAPPPPADSIGLRHWEMILPTTEAWQAAKTQLEMASYPFHLENDHTLVVQDPSQNTLHLISGNQKQRQ